MFYRILPSLLVSAIVALVALFLAAFVVLPAIWSSTTRTESIASLREAESLQDLTNAVGSLGVVLHLTNQAWIAIRYRDTHGGSLRSCAVARDSGGGWFESDVHFCGRLRGWHDLREKVNAYAEALGTNASPEEMELLGAMRASRPASFEEMMAIEAAPGLPAARLALQRMGFRPLEK